MQYRQLIIVLIATGVLCGCGTDSALGRAEQSCLKYPTPSARADCEGRARADAAAYRMEAQKNEDAARARARAEVAAQEAAAADGKSDAKSEPQKKSGLCFKRESTGEVVCPN